MILDKARVIILLKDSFRNVQADLSFLVILSNRNEK